MIAREERRAPQSEASTAWACGTAEPGFPGQPQHLSGGEVVVREPPPSPASPPTWTPPSGHRILGMFDRHNIVSDEDLRAALEQIGEIADHAIGDFGWPHAEQDLGVTCASKLSPRACSSPVW
jgi:hypothetical protein